MQITTYRGSELISCQRGWIVDSTVLVEGDLCQAQETIDRWHRGSASGRPRAPRSASRSDPELGAHRPDVWLLERTECADRGVPIAYEVPPGQA